MSNLKIMPKGRLTGWVERLMSRQFRVVGPKALHGHYVFGDIENPDELVLDYPTTVLPPKKYLLPQREELFSFNTKTMEMKSKIEVEPTVIFGIHTCDMHALTLLDKVHDTGYTDQHYKARRDATYLISVECLKPCMEGAFCKSMGTLTAPENFDLHFTDMGEVYAIDIGSDKGLELLQDCTSVWDPTDDDYEQLDNTMAEKWPNFQYRLDFDISELPELLAASQKSPVWDELGERCLACGMCTQVCPTCYCFDVSDEVDLTLENGTRVRTWDSCQIDKFAVVAGGHDFRNEQAKRQRHRFMRKGKYQHEAYGLLGCVGCGRCAAACLVDITPIKTFNELHKRHRTPQTKGEELKS